MRDTQLLGYERREETTAPAEGDHGEVPWVEAATNVLNDANANSIREVVERIFSQRIEQGQLRDAPLTLRQLDLIKEQFVRVLVGMHHNRIDYPTASGGITSEFAAV